MEDKEEQGEEKDEKEVVDCSTKKQLKNFLKMLTVL